MIFVIKLNWIKCCPLHLSLPPGSGESFTYEHFVRMRDEVTSCTDRMDGEMGWMEWHGMDGWDGE